jgi:ATP-dependent helicase/nuclease subunit B
LPAAKKSQSLIPFDVAKAFELPTYQDQDAIIQYHFYRLLQRAKKVALVYVEPVDTYGGKKEKSRFLLQIENDLKLQNPKISITYQSASLNSKRSDENTEDLKITKTPEILDKIKQNFLKGVSPTSLDTYIGCSLRYYFTHVVGIREAEGVEEELGSDKFGTILHEILEEIFREHSAGGSKVGIEALKTELQKVEERVKAKFEDKKYVGYTLSGQNYLGYKMIIKNLEDFLHQQIRELTTEIEQGGSFKILGLEVRKYNIEPILNPDYVTIQSANILVEKEGEKVELNLKGIIDRIDYAAQTIRIVDYKTGKVVSKDLKIEEKQLDTWVNDEALSKARQLWLYKYILLKNIEQNRDFQEYKDKNVVAGIYSMRNLQDDKGAFLCLDTPKNIEDNFIEITEKSLQNLVLEILDTQKPFEKTPTLETCEWCNFRGICGR